MPNSVTGIELLLASVSYSLSSVICLTFSRKLHDLACVASSDPNHESWTAQSHCYLITTLLLYLLFHNFFSTTTL